MRPDTVMRKTVVVMQPTYLPWIGYFDLMDQADVFVFLDSVQFEKSSWQQRNRIKSKNGELILTVPVLSKNRLAQRICEAEINPRIGFAERHLKSIRNCYSRAPYFSAIFPDLETIYARVSTRLVDVTLPLIGYLKDRLDIRTPLLRSSEMPPLDGKPVERLAAICRHIGAAMYLSTPGSREYIEQNDVFSEQGIELRYHEYAHPVYRQLYDGFIPYLSALDVLMNHEPSEAARIMRVGRVQAGVAREP